MLFLFWYFAGDVSNMEHKTTMIMGDVVSSCPLVSIPGTSDICKSMMS